MVITEVRHPIRDTEGAHPDNVQALLIPRLTGSPLWCQCHQSHTGPAVNTKVRIQLAPSLVLLSQCHSSWLSLTQTQSNYTSHILNRFSDHLDRGAYLIHYVLSIYRVQLQHYIPLSPCVMLPIQLLPVTELALCAPLIIPITNIQISPSQGNYIPSPCLTSHPGLRGHRGMSQ